MYKGPFPLDDRSGVRIAIYPPWGYLMYDFNGWRSSINGSFTSVRTPNFRTLPRSDLPHNPFQHIFDKVEMSQIREDGVVMNGLQINGGWRTGYLDDRNVFTFSEMVNGDDVERRARKKVLDKLRDSSVNLAQAFAERRQTAGLIAKSVNRLASAALAIRRGNLKHAARLFSNDGKPSSLWKDIPPHPKNLANHWLEFQYGWKPLLSDIYGSAELLAKTFNSQRPLIVRSRVSENYVLPFKVLAGRGTNNGLAELRCLSSGQNRHSYVIQFREDEAFLARMASTGITNPLALAWELLPYSFVVDWFIPVGDYLNNLTATNGLTFVRGSSTSVMHWTHSASWVTVRRADPGIEWGVSADGPHKREYFAKTRTVLSSFPTPPLPTLEPFLGVTRTLSGIALLTQLFGRSRA